MRKIEEIDFRDDLLYTELEDWVRLEGDYALIGITDIGQDKLGEIINFEFPAVGSVVSRISEETIKIKKANPKYQSPHQIGEGDLLYIVESFKAAFEVSAPLSGEVVEINDMLDPAEVNKNPYDLWIIKLKPSNFVNERVCLMEVDAYKKYSGL